MKSIHQLKQEKQEAVNKLLTDCLVFFAFSDEQFHKNKTPLQEGEKYVRMAGGGFIPRGKVKAMTEGLKKIDKEYKQALTDNKARRANIMYELANHEAYYTGCIEDTLEALGEDYTKEEVQNVFNVERKIMDEVERRRKKEGV